MSEVTTDLLRAILNVTARAAFPPEKLTGIVQSAGAGDKQIAAYNMCDGSRSQTEIAKELGLDSGNFSRTISRWMDAGVVFRIGDGRDARLMHVYPLPREHGRRITNTLPLTGASKKAHAPRRGSAKESVDE